MSARMAAFIAEELLPLMAGSWPASANQLDANARGVALAWGGVLRGFTPAQIREAVMCMATEAERQFAPRPAEVLAEIFRRQAATAAPTRAPRLEISIRACEMEATVIVLQRDGDVTSEAVQVELDRILTDRRQRGFAITGRI
ncbi:hypothetical protein [Aeromonas sp. SG16]|uniref:hypothetical protein n=1 Tax=Aeromonas sp. SG16 TaxID=2950548 RepID=UPI00210895EE|nr:hypothetical protein [Aeromonas sp. SG16]MCQ4052333.1 hypothetical protein [Aeromonas sp. SG16]